MVYVLPSKSPYIAMSGEGQKVTRSDEKVLVVEKDLTSLLRQRALSSDLYVGN